MACVAPTTHNVTHADLPRPVAALGTSLWQVAAQVPTKDLAPKEHLLHFKVANLPANHILEAVSIETKMGYETDECGENPVTLSGNHLSLTELLRSISQQTNTIISQEANHIRLRCDSPYLKIYSLDYLALERRMRDESRLDSNLEHRNAEQQTRTGNQSQFRLSNEQTHNVWGVLVSQIEAILDHNQEIEETRRVRSVQEDNSRDYKNNRGLESASEQDKQKRDVTITRKQVLSGKVVAHPESGTLAVTASEKQHAEVQLWLEAIETRLTRQVAVDAIIAEVSLSQSYSKGIDWSALQKNGVSLGLAVQGLDVPQAAFTVSLSRQTGNSETSLILRLLEEFGNTSVISSPRIVALNQQPAVLKLIDNRVFFTTEVQTSAPTNNSAAFSTFNTQIQTVPVGFLMTVTPLVTEDRSIQLRVRPTLTRILGFVPDPNPALAQSNIVSQVPEIQTRELESILQLKDGELVMLGGLKQTATAKRTNGIPGVTGAAASLTQSDAENQQHTELVVLLRAKILDTNHQKPSPQTSDQTRLNNLLKTSFMMQSQSEVQTKRFLELALEQFPESPALAFNLSILAARSGDFQIAKRWLNQAIEFCSNSECTIPTLQWQAFLDTEADAQ